MAQVLLDRKHQIIPHREHRTARTRKLTAQILLSPGPGNRQHKPSLYITFLVFEALWERMDECLGGIATVTAYLHHGKLKQTGEGGIHSHNESFLKFAFLPLHWQAAKYEPCSHTHTHVPCINRHRVRHTCINRYREFTTRASTDIESSPWHTKTVL